MGMVTELEELLQLRELVKKQQEELAQKDEIIQKQQIQIENMMQALLHARKKLFGPSTEATPETPEQLKLFETTEKLAEQLSEDKKKITVAAHTRVPRQPGVRAELLAGIPHEIEEYVINPEETCSVCGAPLKVIGKEIVRTEVEFIPARIRVVQVVRQIGKCTECGTGKNNHLKDHFQKAAVPAKVLSHSIATPSLVAHIMYQKFAMGIPLNRQENDFYRMGLVLPRNNMAHWVIRCSEEWLEPVYNRILEKLTACDVLHMDETRIQCNKEEGKKASSESWMWVIQSATSEEIRATYFHYSRSRSGNVPKELLKDFHGYLVTDAYAGYEKVDDVKRSLCWSHLRRYFIESIPLDNSGKELPGSKGEEGREFINLLFYMEEHINSLSPEERKEKRQTGAKALTDAFWSWVKRTSAIPTTNEKLTKALAYGLNHKEQFQTFLEDGRLEISNNLCESHIRPFATARRAWLFADTPKGAKANAVLYTLVESARANELNVYQYLDYLLTELPELDYAYLKDPTMLDKYLPWSIELPDEIRMNRKNRTCI